MSYNNKADIEASSSTSASTGPEPSGFKKLATYASGHPVQTAAIVLVTVAGIVITVPALITWFGGGCLLASASTALVTVAGAVKRSDAVTVPFSDATDLFYGVANTNDDLGLGNQIAALGKYALVTQSRGFSKADADALGGAVFGFEPGIFSSGNVSLGTCPNVTRYYYPTKQSATNRQFGSRVAVGMLNEVTPIDIVVFNGDSSNSFIFMGDAPNCRTITQNEGSVNPAVQDGDNSQTSCGILINDFSYPVPFITGIDFDGVTNTLIVLDSSYNRVIKISGITSLKQNIAVDSLPSGGVSAVYIANIVYPVSVKVLANFDGANNSAFVVGGNPTSYFMSVDGSIKIPVTGYFDVVTSGHLTEGALQGPVIVLSSTSKGITYVISVNDAFLALNGSTINPASPPTGVLVAAISGTGNFGVSTSISSDGTKLLIGASGANQAKEIDAMGLKAGSTLSTTGTSEDVTTYSGDSINGKNYGFGVIDLTNGKLICDTAYNNDTGVCAFFANTAISSSLIKEVSSVLSSDEQLSKSISAIVSSELSKNPELSSSLSAAVSSELSKNPKLSSSLSAAVSSELSKNPKLSSSEALSSVLSNNPELSSSLSKAVSSMLSSNPELSSSFSQVAANLSSSQPDLISSISKALSSSEAGQEKSLGLLLGALGAIFAVAGLTTALVATCYVYRKQKDGDYKALEYIGKNLENPGNITRRLKQFGILVPILEPEEDKTNPALNGVKPALDPI